MIEAVNIFVYEKLPYSLILGQLFITQIRMEIKFLDDGMHVAKVRICNGFRIAQFPTMRPGNERNKLELQTLQKNLHRISSRHSNATSGTWECQKGTLTTQRG